MIGSIITNDRKIGIDIANKARKMWIINMNHMKKITAVEITFQ